jgi:hypothetical protein
MGWGLDESEKTINTFRKMVDSCAGPLPQPEMVENDSTR